MCGAGIKAGSAGCGTCDRGFFKGADALCSECPDTGNTWNIIRMPLAFVGGIVALGLLVFGGLLVLRHFRGGTVAMYAKRSLALMLQMFSAVQVVVSMRGAAQGGLPPALQTLYSWLGALQVRGRPCV